MNFVLFILKLKNCSNDLSDKKEKTEWHNKHLKSTEEQSCSNLNFKTNCPLKHGQKGWKNADLNPRFC